MYITAKSPSLAITGTGRESWPKSVDAIHNMNSLFRTLPKWLSQVFPFGGTGVQVAGKFVLYCEYNIMFVYRFSRFCDSFLYSAFIGKIEFLVFVQCLILIMNKDILCCLGKIILFIFHVRKYHLFKINISYERLVYTYKNL